MAKTNKSSQYRNNARSLNWVLAFALSVLVIKLVIIANIQNHIWLGADGDNYLKGVDGLLIDGIFSNEEKLLYWPAGYPLFWYFFVKVSISAAPAIVAVFQSVLFSFSVLF